MLDHRRWMLLANSNFGPPNMVSPVSEKCVREPVAGANRRSCFSVEASEEMDNCSTFLCANEQQLSWRGREPREPGGEGERVHIVGTADRPLVCLTELVLSHDRGLVSRTHHSFIVSSVPL